VPARFYGTIEGGYAWRWARAVRLDRLDEDENDPFLPGPAIRLGELNLSGIEWSMGLA